MRYPRGVRIPGVDGEAYDIKEKPDYISFWTNHPEDKNKMLSYCGIKENGRVVAYYITTEEKPDYIKYWYLPTALWMITGIAGICSTIVLMLL